MSFSQKANKLYPEVKFTGISHIHASYALNLAMESPRGNPEALVREMNHKRLTSGMFKLISHFFPDMEWLISPSDFHALCMVDFYRQAQGLNSVETSEMIQNPVTKNIFHVIGRRGPIQFGIRLWEFAKEWGLHGEGENIKKKYYLGFRVRLEDSDEEEEVQRDRVRQVCDIALSIMAKEVEPILEMPLTQKQAATEKQADKVIELCEIIDY